MTKSKKVLSVICALAMVLSLFSAFTVANADAGVKITNEVSTNSREAGTEIDITFKVEGLTTDKARGIQFKMPIDGTTIEYVGFEKGSITEGTIMDNYNNGVFGYVLTNPSGSAVNDGVIGTVKIKIGATALTEQLDVALTNVKVTDGDGTKYDVAGATMAADAVELGKFIPTIGIENTVVAESLDKDAEVKITFKAAGLTTDKARGIQFKMPVDETKFSYVGFEKGSITEGTIMDNFNNGVFGYVLTNPSGSAVNDGVIGTVTLKVVAEGLTEENIDLTNVKLTDGDGAKYDVAGNTAFADAVVIKVSGPVDTTEYTITVDTAVENGTITVDAEKATAGTTINVTATPKDDTYELDTITVNGTAISGTSFKMPAENVTVSATFKEKTVEEEPKPLVLDVKKDATDKIGSKYTIKATAVDTYADPFDLVINVYNADGVSMGFVVYDEVAVGEEIVFYAPAVCEASVNAVDDISESNENLLGEMLATGVRK